MILEILYAYVLGLLSIFSPCTFVIIPVLTSDINVKFRKMLSFLSGVVITFAILGIISAVTGKLLTNFLGPYLYLFAGVITAIAGLNMIGLMEFDVHLFNKVKTHNNFLMGLLYGGVALSCVGPLLASVLTYIVVKANILIGMLLMGVFSLGFITPFVLFAYLITDKSVYSKIAKYSYLMRKLGGIMLLGVSVYLLFIALSGVL